MNSPLTEPKIAIHAHHVTKTYGTGAAKVTALRGVDLDVWQGELMMLVGPSGCGKTTLISVNGAPRREALDRAAVMLGRVGLGDRTHALPAQMSGGQQQRVAIARALVHDPRLIVCDEPTSALDHEAGQRVMELLREVALKEDRSLVIVTHDSRIFGFADRIARMDDGRVVKVTESTNGKEEEIQPRIDPVSRGSVQNQAV
jgi:ABC-type lipoprotein export system ATPase subunit